MRLPSRDIFTPSFYLTAAIVVIHIIGRKLLGGESGVGIAGLRLRTMPQEGFNRVTMTISCGVMKGSHVDEKTMCVSVLSCIRIGTARTEEFDNRCSATRCGVEKWSTSVDPAGRYISATAD